MGSEGDLLRAAPVSAYSDAKCSPRWSHGASCRSCRTPRYFSVVTILAWPSESWICSIAALPLWASLAEVRRRSWGATLSAEICRLYLTIASQIFCGSRTSPTIWPRLFMGRNTRPAGQARRGAPGIQLHLDPPRHGNGAQAAAFTQQVDDRPPAVALLDVLEGDLGGLGAAQPAADH